MGMRPYFVTFNGDRHLVEAPNPEKAIQHVVGAGITELRPARANEVTAWVRAGKPIAEIGKSATEEKPTFQFEDARFWIADQVGIAAGVHVSDEQAAAIQVFDAIWEDGKMTAEQFDLLCASVPNFRGAVVNDIDITGADMVSLGTLPMGSDVLLQFIACRKQQELWALDQVDAAR